MLLGPAVYAVSTYSDPAFDAAFRLTDGTVTPTERRMTPRAPARRRGLPHPVRLLRTRHLHLNPSTGGLQ